MSFNGKFRGEFLNDYYFSNSPGERALIAEYRRDYEGTRLHSALGPILLVQFAMQHHSNSNNAAPS